MTTVTDPLSLLRHFVKGDVPLAANRQLRIQPANERSQLLTNQGQLIAYAEHQAAPPKVAVRPLSPYTELLQKMLLEHEFMPLGLGRSGRFLHYEFHPIPLQHRMSYTTATAFWKYWWANRQQLVGSQKQTDILIFAHRSWMTVENLVFQRGTLFITTESGEVALLDSDRLVWIQPIQPSEAEEDKTVFFVGQPPLDLAQPRRRRSHDNFPSPSAASPAVTQPNPAQLNPVKSKSVVRLSNNRLVIDTPDGKLLVVGDDLRCYPLATGVSPVDDVAPQSSQPSCPIWPDRQLAQAP